MKKRLIKIGEAAKLLGTTPQVMRKWEETGELIPARKTTGGTRYYNLEEILKSDSSDTPTACYIRVSSENLIEEIEQQKAMLESYCSARSWRATTIQDLGSGVNCGRKGFNKLVAMIMRKKIKRLVISHTQSLLRFGSEFIFALCAIQHIEIIITHCGEQPAFEDDTPEDVKEMVQLISKLLDKAPRKP
jgi:putative resolvase